MLALYIGRGKSGSSTIELAVSQGAAALAAAGWHVPSTEERHKGNHGPRIDSWHEAGDPTGLAAEIAGATAGGQRVLMTSEALFTAKQGLIGKLAALAGEGGLHAIAYVRDYPSWIQSYYAQSVRKQASALGFEDFYARMEPRISALPALLRWKRGAGRVVVRPLDAGGVGGRPLIEDLGGFLGVPLAEPARQNKSPHWASLEVRRALSAIVPEPDQQTRQLFNWLCRRVDQRAAAERVPAAGYLDAARWAALDTLYREDMATLRAHGLSDVEPAAAAAPAPSPVAPALGAIPAAVLRAVGADYAHRVGSHADAAIVRLLSVA